MKKLLLTIVILSVGAMVSARFNQQAELGRAAKTQWQTQGDQLANRVDDLVTREANLRAQIQLKKTRLGQLSSLGKEAELLSLLSTAQSGNGWASASAELRKCLGACWDSSADYVLVNKAAIKKVYLSGANTQGELTPTLCEILALTPEERAAIEAALQRMAATHQAWFNTAIERFEPSGDIVADYRVPANPELMELYQKEMGLLSETLGSDRVELLKRFTGEWKLYHGAMGEEAVRLTVHTSPGRPLWSLTEWGVNSGTCDVGNEPLDSLFLGLFPGGWRDLAKREGFALPENFDQPPSNGQPSPK